MTVAEVPVGIGGLLRDFAAAGVLTPSDARVAAALGRLCGESDQSVLLAAALAVRALRLGSVCVDLTEVSGSAYAEALLQDGPQTDVGSFVGDETPLPWPSPVDWLDACRGSSMVSVTPPPQPWLRLPRVEARPLYLNGPLLYLDRYAQLEQLVRTVLRQRAHRSPPPVDTAAAGEVIGEVCAGAKVADEQRLAIAAAVTGWVTVIAGGPGTGKTFTVGVLLDVVERLAECTALPKPRVALTAPTGKAAARLGEQLGGRYSAATVHRLLGWRPQSGNRFRHDWQNRLPADLVVVDETSMVSLELMARLLEALPTSCRLVLVGDPDQLASVDAGAVLADVVERPVRPEPDAREELVRLVAPDALSGSEQATGDVVRGELRRDLVRLRRNHRSAQAIARLADAIRRGDPDGVVAVLRTPPLTGDGVVEWLDVDPTTLAVAPMVRGLRDDVAAAGIDMLLAARRGDPAAALEALGRHRLLCAHRSGRYGVSHWRALAEQWIAEREGQAGGLPWSGDAHGIAVGRPLLVTENDRALNLWNGDTGVIVADGGAVVAVFDRAGQAPLRVPVHRLPAVETPLAMTVHKSQGSEADRVTVVLPPAQSPLLTRELLYTAVTRARHLVRLVATEQSVRAAVSRRVVRASGLRDGWH